MCSKVLNVVITCVMMNSQLLSKLPLSLAMV